MPNRAIVAIFPSENKAFDAANAIKSLSDQGNDLAIKAGIMVHKDDRGNLSFPKGEARPLWGTLGGTVIGGLIGALAGPAGVAAGAALGAVGGLTTDALSDSIDEDFVSSVSADLMPGDSALIIDADEDSTRRVDEVVLANGGRIHRADLD